MIIATFILLTLYVALIAVFAIGWIRVPQYEPKTTKITELKLSLIVACRNEAEHLPRLLQALSEQSLTNFELVLVNDHSTDETFDMMQNAQVAFKQLLVLNATGEGKKNALREGILKASGELIITTDADCIPEKAWLETICKYQTETDADLLVCPVRLSSRSEMMSHHHLRYFQYLLSQLPLLGRGRGVRSEMNNTSHCQNNFSFAPTFFYRIQNYEFVSLVASGAGAAGAGMPILCNGANLAFRKTAWLNAINELHNEIPSGDDVFLLQSVKKRGGVIRFLKSSSAFVVTEPAGSLSAFVKQRRRWASKSSAYTDVQMIFTVTLVFLINVLLFSLLVLCCVDFSFWKITLFCFTVKYVVDTTFLSIVGHFFQLKQVWLYACILSVFYPFYILSVGVSSFLVKPTRWK